MLSINMGKSGFVKERKNNKIRLILVDESVCEREVGCGVKELAMTVCPKIEEQKGI